MPKPIPQAGLTHSQAKGLYEAAKRLAFWKAREERLAKLLATWPTTTLKPVKK